METPDPFRAFQIGNCPGDPKNPMIAPRGKTQPPYRFLQEGLPFGIRFGDGFQQFTIGLGIDPQTRHFRITLCLRRPRRLDAHRDIGGAFSRRRQAEIAGGNGGHIDVKVDPVVKRA